jgi:hypothetical protein
MTDVVVRGRPKLILTDEERQAKEVIRRQNSLKYYHEHNPSKHPRQPLSQLGLSEGLLAERLKKKEYFKNYYKANRENILMKANTWNHSNNRGLAQITTIE